MYQGLALGSNQAGYAHDAGSYVHAPASSPVYVPTTRVPAVLPYFQSCEAAQTHAHGWQSPADGGGFSFCHSPPRSASGRDQSALLLGNGARPEQYGGALVRPVGGTYSAPYAAYVSPDMGPSPGPRDTTTPGSWVCSAARARRPGAPASTWWTS